MTPSMKIMPISRVTNLGDAIRTNVPMMALLGSTQQAADVETAIREFAEDEIGFIRINNPLGSPLSLERLVLQVTGETADDTTSDDVEKVLRALVARSTMRRRIVLIVEKAETLSAEALEFLHGVSRLSHPSLAFVQVALVGTSALGARIADDRTYLIGRAPDIPPVATTALRAPTLEPRAWVRSITIPTRSRSQKLILAGLGLCGVVAVLFMVVGLSQHETTTSSPTLPPTLAPERPLAPPLAAPSPTAEPQTIATQASPPAAPVQPAGQLLTPSPPELAQASPQASPVELPPLPPADPPTDDAAAARVRLYREFNAFIGSRDLGKRLSEAERQALFQEYLARHQSMPPSAQIASPTELAAPRVSEASQVLLFFAAGSDQDRKAAEQQAELLQDRVASIALRPEADMPAVPTIRYEFPADRAAAFALAQTVSAPRGAWQVEDMTTSPKRSEPGTIEMWLPRR